MFYILFFYLKKWVNRSFPLLASDGSESLRSLTKNERPWGICSHRSEEICDRERIAQVVHKKWANEWIASFFEQIAHSLIFWQKTSDSLGKPMSEFPALPFNHIFKIMVPDFTDSVFDSSCNSHSFLVSLPSSFFFSVYFLASRPALGMPWNRKTKEWEWVRKSNNFINSLTEKL